MITKDYLNDFNSPIRNITGKAELYKSSVSTLYGNYLSLGMVAPGEKKINVKATSKNLWRFEDMALVMRNNTNGSEKINTGVRVTCAYSTNDGWMSNVYRWLPISMFDGKTITVSLEVTASGNNKPIFIFGYMNEDGSNRNSFGKEINKSGSYTVTVDSNSQYAKGYDYIGFWFYGNGGGVCNAGEYVDYTNIQVEIGSTATPYTPFMDLTKSSEEIITEGFVEGELEYNKIYTVSTYNSTYERISPEEKEWTLTYTFEEEDAWYVGMWYEYDEPSVSIGDKVIFDGQYLKKIAETNNTITVSGKNLLPKNYFYDFYPDRDNECWVYGLPHGTYTLSGWITKYPDDTSTATRLKLVIYYKDGTTTLKFVGMDYECAESDGVPRFKQGTITTDTTKEIDKFFVSLDYSALNKPNRIAENVMLEFGSTATEYEPYQEPTVYTIGETATVDVAPYNPTTSICSNVSGMLLETTYNALTLSNTFTHTDALKEISINRVGEKGRFFGFDITQKATINLLDKNRELEVSNNDFFKVFFNINDNDYVNNTPLFKATDTKRDENTNALTITAEDLLMCAAGGITVAEMGLTAYSIRDIAEECARMLGLGLVVRGFEDETCFDTYYETGANFDGTETVREVIKAIAEATQSIAYLTADSLVFRRLGGPAADLTIEKQHYFTLKNDGEKTLANICHTTSLGDNVISTSSALGATQYVRDNPFWDMREDIATLVDKAAAAISGFTLSQFDCSWRGNFLLEIGDRIDINAKDGSMLTSYLLEDTISYKGGYNQTSTWAYEAQEETAANPSTLGEVIKQTFAKVDKANKQIEMVVSETKANKEAIATLQMTTGGITASVSSLEETVKGNQEATNEELSTLRNKVDLQITPEQVNIAIQEEMSKGVDKVITSTGYSFTSEGLNVSKSDSDVSTVISHEGMEVAAAGQEMLVANHEGVNAVNLKAKNYLIIDGKSRFQTWNKRTACFWIGGK